MCVCPGQTVVLYCGAVVLEPCDCAKRIGVCVATWLTSLPANCVTAPEVRAINTAHVIIIFNYERVVLQGVCTPSKLPRAVGSMRSSHSSPMGRDSNDSHKGTISRKSHDSLGALESWESTTSPQLALTGALVFPMVCIIVC